MDLFLNKDSEIELNNAQAETLKKDIPEEYQIHNNSKLLFENLIQKFKSDTLPHAILFYGINKLDRINFIEKIIQNIVHLDQKKIINTKNILQNNIYPYILIFDCNKDNITVDNIRTVGHFNSLKSSIGNIKIIIINEIDRLNKSSVNALLKVLEEPQKNTFIFITCNNYFSVIPTILSRCVKYNIFNSDATKPLCLASSQNLSPSDISILSEISNNLNYEVERLINENFLNILECVCSLLLEKYITITKVDKVLNLNISFELFSKDVLYILCVINPEAVNKLEKNHFISNLIAKKAVNNNYESEFYDVNDKIMEIVQNYSEFNMDLRHSIYAILINLKKLF